MDYVSDEELARLEAIAARARQLALGQAPSQNYYQQGGWGAGGGNGVVNPEAIARWKAEQAANAAKLAGMQSVGGGLPPDPAYDAAGSSGSPTFARGSIGGSTPGFKTGGYRGPGAAVSGFSPEQKYDAAGRPTIMDVNALGPDNWREKLAAMREPPRPGGMLLSDALARAKSRKGMRNRMSDLQGIDTPEGFRLAAEAEQAAEQRFAGEAGAPLLTRLSSDTPAAARRKILLAAARAGKGPTDTQPSDLTTARNPVTYAMDLAARKVAATEKAHQRQLARQVRLGGPGVLMAEMLKRGGNGAGGEGGAGGELPLMPIQPWMTPEQQKLVANDNLGRMQHNRQLGASKAEDDWKRWDAKSRIAMAQDPKNAYHQYSVQEQKGGREPLPYAQWVTGWTPPEFPALPGEAQNAPAGSVAGNVPQAAPSAAVPGKPPQSRARLQGENNPNTPKGDLWRQTAPPDPFAVTGEAPPMQKDPQFPGIRSAPPGWMKVGPAKGGKWVHVTTKNSFREAWTRLKGDPEAVKKDVIERGMRPEVADALIADAQTGDSRRKAEIRIKKSTDARLAAAGM